MDEYNLFQLLGAGLVVPNLIVKLFSAVGKAPNSFWKLLKTQKQSLDLHLVLKP
jgi:hypothetical protein